MLRFIPLAILAAAALGFASCTRDRAAGCSEAGMAGRLDTREVFTAFLCPDGVRVLKPIPGATMSRSQEREA